MDIFFNQRRTYIIYLPFEEVREIIQSITTRKWYDFSENISGRMTDAGDYIFTQKWSFVSTSSLGMPAYLEVKLIKDDNNTKIETLLRPNAMFVIIFYLIIVLFFLELAGKSFLEGPKIFIFIFLPAFDLILFGIMMFLTSGLKNRFEKIMQLR